MGNWDNFYYEAYTEMQQDGTRDKFNQLIEKLSTTDEFRHRSVREKWSLALRILKNEQ